MSKEIIKYQKPEIIFPHCEINKVGLTFSSDINFDEWEMIGQTLNQIEGSTQWWIGDWLNTGEQKWGEKYKEAEERTGFDYETLKGSKWVSSSIELCRRRHNLSWSHHQEVAPFEADKQDYWLDRAEKEELTRQELRRLIKESKPENVLAPIEGQYEVIVMDPPWPYGTEYDPDSRRVASPYKELPLEQLQLFKLPAADNCVLWLWTTHRFLHDAIHLIETWNFEYKLSFVWDKEKMGTGAWLRCQAEFCLLAIKGKSRWNLTNERDLLRIAKRKHSTKPDEFYSMVEKLCPTNGKRADIFSRKNRPGWKSYGDEI